MKRQNKKKQKENDIDENSEDYLAALKQIEDFKKRLQDSGMMDLAKKRIAALVQQNTQASINTKCDTCVFASKCPEACRNSSFCPKQTRPRHSEFMYFTPQVKAAFEWLPIN